MKKIYYLMSLLVIVAISSALILTGCKKENDELLDIAMSTKLTAEQWAVYNEATRRIEPHVTFEEGQFVMSLNAGYKVGISERLFDIIRGEMENTNKLLQNEYRQSKVSILLSDKKVKIVDRTENFDFVLTKYHEPFNEKGGITDFELSFDNGLTLYLSNGTLGNLGRAIELGGVISGAYLGGLSGAAIGAIITTSGWTISDLQDAYPNGIIIYHAGPGAYPPPLIIPQPGN